VQLTSLRGQTVKHKEEMTEEQAAPVPENTEDPAAPPAEGEGEDAPPMGPPCYDLSEHVIKIDHFAQIQGIPEPNVIGGAPNFRQVPGFPVFGTGQPTEEGFSKVMEKIPKGTEEKPAKIMWYNMRQEPVIYLNGISYAPRDPKQPHSNLEIVDPIPELENLQRYFSDIIQKRVDGAENATIKVHKDAAYVENPMEREDVEESLVVKSVTTVESIFDNLKEAHGLQVLRVPIIEEKAPAEESFDILVNSLKNEPASTNCIFSCQMGRGRTTVGMIVACLVKEVQISSELQQMSTIGLVTKETVDDLIKTKFEYPLPSTPDDDDPFIKGEFDVIKELMEKHPEMIAGKKKIDYVINLNGPQPKGVGMQNLRECVIETKWKYDVAAEEKQGALKQMILSFLERYFYLICFATYTLEHGPTGFTKTFVSWMDDRKELREMIENGKDKLEWYRQVDPAKLNTLKDLINSPNYKENLGKLINTVYDFAFQTYSDLPRGPIKNNSMRKLAAKTLLEILPPDIAKNVNKQMEEQQCTSSDFVTVVGLVSYYGDGEQ